MHLPRLPSTSNRPGAPEPGRLSVSVAPAADSQAQRSAPGFRKRTARDRAARALAPPTVGGVRIVVPQTPSRQQPKKLK